MTSENPARREQRVSLEALLPAAPAAAFRAWTDPEALGKWLTGRVELDLREGGRFDMVLMPDGLDLSGVFIALAPERGFLVSWEALGVEESLLEVALAPVPEGCRLQLTHHGLPTAAAADLYREQWTAALERLRNFLDGVHSDAGSLRFDA